MLLLKPIQKFSLAGQRVVEGLGATPVVLLLNVAEGVVRLFLTEMEERGIAQDKDVGGVVDVRVGIDAAVAEHLEEVCRHVGGKIELLRVEGILLSLKVEPTVEVVLEGQVEVLLYLFRHGVAGIEPIQDALQIVLVQDPRAVAMIDELAELLKRVCRCVHPDRDIVEVAAHALLDVGTHCLESLPQGAGRKAEVAEQTDGASGERSLL